MMLPSLAAAIVLAIAYATGRRFDVHGTASGIWSRRWVSAAAGVSVAYVFVDLLPELAEQNKAIVAAAGGETALFAEQRVYILVLISFVLLYGIQYVVLAAHEKAGEHEPEPGFDALYALHLGGYALYSALIGYLLIERSAWPLALALYTVAMALHFLIVDHALVEEHGQKYVRWGRWILAGSVLAGWVIGELTPLSEANFARLFAVLAGGVVITSLRSELPDQRRGEFLPFCLGAMLFALVLLFV